MPALKRLAVAALLVASFATVPPRASADTVDSLNLTLTGGGNGINYGGPFHWTQTTPVNTNFATAVTTYCIDTQDYVRSGTFTTHTDLTKAPTIAATTNPTATAAAITTLYDHFYSSSFQSTTNEAAFQLALWELIYGTNYKSEYYPNAPTAAVAQQASNLLNGTAYNGTEHDLANAHLVALVDATSTPGTSGRNQDQLLVAPNGVPAPPALLLAGMGVIVLAGRARWVTRAAA
jgi:hypothetical protein